MKAVVAEAKYEEQDYSVTMGVDTEVFFVDEDNKIVPSELILPFNDDPIFSKQKWHIDSSNTSVPIWSLHTDGIQGEITGVFSTCRAYTIDPIFYGFKALNKIVEEKSKELDKNIKISFTPAIDFDLDSFLDLNLDFRSIRFGCNPESIAWLDGDELLTPSLSMPVRSAGGHIHLGASNIYSTFQTKDVLFDKSNKIKLVKLMDLLVALPTLLISPQKDREKQRRNIYGKAGSFRNKKYGIEYRVLSPYFTSDKKLMQMILALSRNCVAQIGMGLFDEYMERIDTEKLIIAINECDDKLATDLLNKVDDIFSKNLTEFGHKGLKTPISIFDIIASTKLLNVGWPIHRSGIHGNYDVDFTKILLNNLGELKNEFN